MKQLLQVSLRQQAIYVPNAAIKTNPHTLTPVTACLVANIAKLGFGVSEALLYALEYTSTAFHEELLELLKEVTGTNKNWTPLVKGWNNPTHETLGDHLVTWFVNAFRTSDKAPGVELPCGHLIPEGTFPLERYNGCPFCGTPFIAGDIENYGQNSKVKVLELWTDKELDSMLNALLASRTALDATQRENLQVLLQYLPAPTGSIAMKETLMLVIDMYIAEGSDDKAQALFNSPADIMRYLWYKHTGNLQLVQPKVIVERTAKNNGHLHKPLDKRKVAAQEAKEKLKLKYNRTECLRVAKWLNGLDMDTEKMCEIMHPKRAMWTRFIRALRLIEYGKRKDFERLGALMEMFCKEKYDVWQGWVNHFRVGLDADNAFELLKQRPGMFARSLFSNMLWFGEGAAVPAFAEVAGKVPARLLITLAMYADNYFDKDVQRTVKPLGGVSKAIPGNQLLSIYTDEQLTAMKTAVTEMCMKEMGRRFASATNEARTIFIDPLLFKMPLAIGDRAETVQDLPSALMGARFPVEGDAVRLFMQWGTGLPAQHLDMDLSAVIVYADKKDVCSYSNLVTTGCKHSGDIRQVPDKIGTAEYIELELNTLVKADARYVVFTCNAFSNGAITPQLAVGWMNSKYPMKISATTGVAYDPACVQHQVRITGGLTKGLVFGVLDVKQREVIWLEMPFSGQLGGDFNMKAVNGMLARLDGKMSIGALLSVKAEAQQLVVVNDEAAADEVYNQVWARDAAAVTQLLID
ncbi:hypothetical protein [uncultured Chitinophaga sp.]|uniref:hypothetical protein n=1 Tax=uncultured Chitinophaga sp. TaxID=339340 RepID=UPI0025EFAA8A|nr:hypothetical protein [uncultured Chitinophaga sp.]